MHEKWPTNYGPDPESYSNETVPIVPEERPMVEIGKTPTGYTIWMQENGVGGHTYWSDSIGGGVMIWDTTLASTEELEFCMNYEHLRQKYAGRE